MPVEDRAAPHFLGIGANRAGTTWLWRNLRCHPDLWMPPVKELHYFDRSRSYASPSHLADDGLWRRLSSADPHGKPVWRQLARDIGRSLAHLAPGELRWTLRYYTGSADDRWYGSLFRPGAGKVTGEITPAYSILSEPDVQRVSEVAPRARLILLLRNPVHRTWSQLRQGWTAGGLEETDAVATLLERCDDPAVDARSDYLRTIRTWRRHFPEQSFFIGFYDDIQQSPETLLRRIFAFLGVSADRFSRDSMVRERTNASRHKDLPDPVRLHLTRRYHDGIKGLSEMLGGHATAWLAEADEILRRG